MLVIKSLATFLGYQIMIYWFANTKIGLTPSSHRLVANKRILNFILWTYKSEIKKNTYLGFRCEKRREMFDTHTNREKKLWNRFAFENVLLKNRNRRKLNSPYRNRINLCDNTTERENEKKRNPFIHRVIYIFILNFISICSFDHCSENVDGFIFSSALNNAKMGLWTIFTAIWMSRKREG